ncbi:sensor histidine kinase [Corynebacterium sp. 35RC1]|nr:sensor histidine kinase [Corynebacterium sp. 35RC1]
MEFSLESEMENTNAAAESKRGWFRLPELNREESNIYSTAPGANKLAMAVNTLTSVLLVVALVQTGQQNQAFIAVGLTAAFAMVYATGMLRRDTRQDVSEPWLRLLWIALLTAVWVLMLPVIPVAVYLVLPMYFMVLRVIPDIRGVVAIVALTFMAVMSRWPDITFGAVVGPVVSALVVIGMHLAFVASWRGAREREALIEELMSTRNQLAATERAAGVAEERQRIAHEIHDTLAQGLSSIQMLLRVAEQDIRNSSMSDEERVLPLKRMELARQTAADNLGEARAMIAALQPAALSKTSLEGALHRAASQVVGPEVCILVEGEERQLPMRTEASLLRIAQGALGNVAKHAHATRCQVTLTYEEDEVRLDVVDDGQGFDPAAVSSEHAGLGHIGLAAMRQRAREQGGVLEVESAPGEGTAVSLALPINQKG